MVSFNFISEFVISCGICSPCPPPPPLYSVVIKSMEHVEMNGLSSVSRLYQILAGGQGAVANLLDFSSLSFLICELGMKVITS